MVQATIVNGDCLDVLRAMPDASIDSIVTDPPYGLGFMGKKWDIGIPAVDIFAECLRVLKPGGHLLAFGGSRTYHRLAVAVEDAGFDIRDQIMWVYGSGFPKSRNIGREVEGMEGWGTALKPAHEPIVVARKPIKGTVAANVLAHGTGALNIDGCRVHVDDAPTGGFSGQSCDGSSHTYGRWADRGQRDSKQRDASTGRFPANLIHDGSEEVAALFPSTKSGKMKAGTPYRGGNVYGAPAGSTKADTYGDQGSAARFYYCAKASKADRTERGTVENRHPTVKPTDLMRYLCRLVTPPGGTVLDPFAGSGSTGKAAVLEGASFIGIEREAEYMPIIEGRVAHALDSYWETAA